jgi:hypothetical protein
VHSLFLAKSQFLISSESRKEKLPIKNDEESSLVNKRFEISNQRLFKDVEELIRLGAVLSAINSWSGDS